MCSLMPIPCLTFSKETSQNMGAQKSAQEQCLAVDFWLLKKQGRKLELISFTGLFQGIEHVCACAFYLDCRKKAERGQIIHRSEQTYYKSEIWKPSATLAENCQLQCDQGGIFGMLFNSCVTITPVGSIKVRASFVLSAFADKTDLSQKIYSIYIYFSDVYLFTYLNSLSSR